MSALADPAGDPAGDTIVAIATPPGTGALAIVRLSGPAAVAVADGAFRGRQPLREAATHTAHYGRIVQPAAAAEPAVDGCIVRPAAAAATTGGGQVAEPTGSAVPAGEASVVAPGSFTGRVAGGQPESPPTEAARRPDARAAGWRTPAVPAPATESRLAAVTDGVVRAGADAGAVPDGTASAGAAVTAASGRSARPAAAGVEAARSLRDTEDDENRYTGIACWPAFSDQASGDQLEPPPLGVLASRSTPTPGGTTPERPPTGGQEVVDDVVAVVFRAPASYTGEDTVEITCHGSNLVAATVVAALLHHGARAADPGEFTRRAFLNGKLDLTQAEAVAEVIQSATAASLRGARNRLSGALGAQVADLRRQLLECAARVELELDFAEEDLELAPAAEIAARVGEVRTAIGAMLATFHTGRMLRDGVHVVLAGPPNVGKSSLLNRLTQESRALVTDIPGTTRDVIHEDLDIHGVPVRLHDTAGLRVTDETVERLGVERSIATVADADLVLFVTAADEPFPQAALEQVQGAVAGAAAAAAVVVIANKCDLTPPVPGARASAAPAGAPDDAAVDAAPAGAPDDAAVDAAPAGAPDAAVDAAPAGAPDAAVDAAPAGAPDDAAVDAAPAGAPDAAVDAAPAGAPDDAAVDVARAAAPAGAPAGAVDVARAGAPDAAVAVAPAGAPAAAAAEPLGALEMPPGGSGPSGPSAASGPIDGGRGQSALAVSAKTGEGMDALSRLLVARTMGEAGSGYTERSSLVASARHRDNLQRADAALVRAQQAVTAGAGGELVAADLRVAITHLEEIVGIVASDDVLDQIFAHFCIGK